VAFANVDAEATNAFGNRLGQQNGEDNMGDDRQERRLPGSGRSNCSL